MLRWFDAFELATTAAINARYDSGSVGGVGTSSGRTNQYADLSGGSIVKTIPTTTSVLIGLARKLDGNERDLIQIYDSASGRQLTLRETGGTLALYRGDPTGAGVLLATSDSITSGFWVYIELRAVIDNAAGEYELKVNETSMFSATGVDTQATGNADVGRVTVNGRLTNLGAVTCLIDDYYIADLAAPMPLGDFYGNTKIEQLMPSGAGTYSTWTPSTGSNYECVDENPHNSDVDYVYASTVSDMDTYAVQNMSAISGNVRGVQLTAVARKDDALARSIATLVRSNGSDFAGDTQALSTTYAHYYQRYDEDPATSSEWSIAGVNAIEIGAEVIA